MTTKWNSRRGQTIVEAMVAMSILLIGLMGVLTLLSRSLLLARTTSDQAKATYLASEGIEIAKSLIDHGVYLGIADPGATGAGWGNCFFSGQSYDLDSATTECPFPNFDANKPLYFSPSTHLFYSYDDANLPSDATATNFTREITVTNVSANEIDVQSKVTWNTGVVIGQSLTLEDHFYNWRPPGGASGSPVSPSIPNSTSTPPSVVISSNSSSVALGSPLTFTWSALNAFSCTASGAWSGNQPVAGTSSTIPNALGSKTYALSCTGPNGTANSSVTINVIGATSPDSPTLSSATPGDGQVLLSWAPPSSDGGSSITQYLISTRLTNSSEFSFFTATTANQTTSTVSSLINGQSYDFEIVAQNNIGTSTPSNILSATPVAPAAVTNAPTNLSATPGDGQVLLSWTAPSSTGGSPILNYIIDYRPSSISTWSQFGLPASTSTSATIIGLTNGLAYDFEVYAASTDGTSASASNVTTATPITSSGTPVSSASTTATYYVDNTIPDTHPASATPDCTTYDPTKFTCGDGFAIAYATIADINANKTFKPGNQILFRRGETWREQLMPAVSGSATSGPITFSAYGDPSAPLPIISGANIITNWTPQTVGNGTIYSSPYTNNLLSDSNAQRVVSTTQMFEDGMRLTQNTTSFASLTPGQWYINASSPSTGTLYLRLNGDDNPSKHTIEASQRNMGIYIYYHFYINISDIRVIDAASVGINYNNPPRIIVGNTASISNVDIEYSDFQGINVDYFTNFQILHSVIAYNGSDGIILTNTPNMLVDENIVHDNVQTLPSILDYQVPAGIHGGGLLSTNMIIQNNLVYNNGLGTGVGRGIDLDTIGSGTVIRYNKSYNNRGDGIELDADSGDTAYGNVVYNNSNYGIRAFGDWDTTAMNSMQIYNNTVYGNTAGGIRMAGPAQGATASSPAWAESPNGCINNVVKNNIAVGSLNGPNFIATLGCENPTDGIDGSGNVYTFNDFGVPSSNFIVWGQTTKGAGIYESTYNAWETAPGNCGTVGCSHSVESDPLFVSASSGNFTLSLSSPAVGAGANLGSTYQEDLDPASTWPSGVILRNQNSTWDIGAYVEH